MIFERDNLILLVEVNMGFVFLFLWFNTIHSTQISQEVISPLLTCQVSKHEIICPDIITIFLKDSQLTLICHKDEYPVSFPKHTYTEIIRSKIEKYVLVNCPLTNSVIRILGNNKPTSIRIEGHSTNTEYKWKTTEHYLFSDFRSPLVVIRNTNIKELPVKLFTNSLITLKICCINLDTIPERTFEKVIPLLGLTIERTNLTHLPNFIFQNLPLLRSLDLSYNELENLEEHSFAGLEELQQLYLNNNKLYNLPANIFEHLQILRYLDLSANHFTDISDFLWPLIKLQNLRVNNCNLSHINTHIFEHMSVLQILELANNPFLNISGIFTNKLFGTYSFLFYIDLQNGGLKDSSPHFLSSSPYLQVLDLSRNQIKTFSSVNHPYKRLRSLLLNNNLIEKFEINALQNFDSIGKLDLSNNKLKYLDPEIFNFGNDSEKSHQYEIYELFLSNNLLEEIHPTISQNLVYLMTLDLSHNKLKYLDPETFYGLRCCETGTTESYGNFSFLNLSNNALQNIDSKTFQNLTKLYIVDLSYNKLSVLHQDMFVGSYNILQLNLSHNNLTHIADSLRSLSKLQALDLSHNKFEDLPHEILAYDNVNLIDLDLSYNNIDELSFARYDIRTSGALQRLTITNNKIRIVEKSVFYGLPNLIYLNLADNVLVLLEMDPYPNSNLQHLDLSNNSLSYIPKNTIFLKKMHYFNLAHNQIKLIPSEELRVTSFNLSISIQNNLVRSIDLKLRDLNVGDIESNSTVRLNLNHNPFLCDCHIFKFLRLQDRDIYILPEELNVARITADNLSCSEPKVLERAPVSNIEDWAPQSLALFGLCLLDDNTIITINN